MSQETSQEAENIDEEPLAQVSVATEKSTEDPLPSIDAIWPITGKYLINYICLTSLTHAKCGTRSTLCWKILNISDSTELFAL